MRTKNSYILHFSLTNHARLDRQNYLMEYRGVQFKLVQEHGWKWADHLLTIIPDFSPLAKQHAFEIGQELVNLLSWQLRSPMQLAEAGGGSCRHGTRLSQARPSIRMFRTIPFGGNFVNNSPSIIPAVDTEQQRLALGLFREARASNNDYFAFLFYWHVIETGYEKGAKVVDRIYAANGPKLARDDIARLSLGGRSLGEHLQENVRNAIAHIKRWSGRKPLELNNLEQRNEMTAAARVARRIAEAYIEFDLGIGKRQLFLMRKGRSGFPVYIDHTREMDPWRWRDAYPRKPMRF